MGTLWMKIEGEDVSASKVLGAAKNTLSILREIDKSQNGKATIKWQVNITSTPSLVVIGFVPSVGKSEQHKWDTVREMQSRLKQAATPSPDAGSVK